MGALLLKGSMAATCGGWRTSVALVSALAAKNIGSGLNFVAVSQVLCIPQKMIAVALVVDNIVGLAYFPLASSLTPLASSKTEIGPRYITDHCIASDVSGRRWRSAALTLLVAGSIALVSEVLAPPRLVCVASTLLAVGLASLPRARSPYPSGEILGLPLLYLYFASAGFSAGRITPSSVLEYSPLLLFDLILYGVHLLVVVVGGWSMQLERAELMVASSANIGGPATASSLAAAKGCQHLVRPALLLGMLGNAVGTAIGLAVFRLLVMLNL